MDHPTIAACATPVGGHSAIIRLSGPAAGVIAARAGLSLPAPWQALSSAWALPAGDCPCRVLFAPGPRSFTGTDLVEITLPGAADLIAFALEALLAAGAQAAAAGAFTRQALANGRLGLDQAEAILALVQAPDAAAAAQALARLRGALGAELAQVRDELIGARALVEAGLDFVDEADVRAYDPPALRARCQAMHAVLARWRIAADALEARPTVVLVGPANAGKSALFNRLVGDAASPALVSAQPGTTRDWLDGEWDAAGRSVRLVDTAGWLDGAASLDQQAIAAGAAALAGAALVLACSAPDARLSALPESLPAERTLIIATKHDLGPADARAVHALSAATGAGIAQLAGLVAARLGGTAAGEPRQQRLLAAADELLIALTHRLPPDELLADDLRRAGDLLGELLGATTTDDVLEAIFSRFCIGK